MNRIPIIAGMATIPGREKACKEAVESLEQQVSQIFVYMNNGARPGGGVFMNPGVYYRQNEDMGDFGKFDGFLGQSKFGEKFIYLSVDDDLIYPPNYVSTIVNWLYRYPQSIVSFHGRKIPGKIKSYYRDPMEKFACLGGVNKVQNVNCIGTGCAAFFIDTVNITQKDFPLSHMNMADIHLAIYAQKNQIPMKVLPHPGGWIKHSPHVKAENTIWGKHKNDDSLQTERVNSWKKWRIYK